MFTVKKKFVVSAVALITFLASCTLSASASYINNHGYDINRVTCTNIKGGEFISTSGASAIHSNWSARNNPNSLITNEMWIGGNGYWVEAGDLAGAAHALGGQYYHGSFAAYKSTAGFQQLLLNNGIHIIRYTTQAETRGI